MVAHYSAGATGGVIDSADSNRVALVFFSLEVTG